ncbi:MAG: hypothetical protein IPL27_03570 [Lewinellaceae bacterium]|nr:hypothetical protein [Lewinellaceae bacterium]
MATLPSPCSFPVPEVEAYFLLAGAQGWRLVLAVAVIYTLVSGAAWCCGSGRFAWHESF